MVEIHDASSMKLEIMEEDVLIYTIESLYDDGLFVATLSDGCKTINIESVEILRALSICCTRMAEHLSSRGE